MSYILDALRRADAERERGAVPGLHTANLAAPVGPPSHATASAAGGARGRWWLLPAGLAVLALLALAWWLGRSAAPVPPAVPAGATGAAAGRGASPAEPVTASRPSADMPSAGTASFAMPTVVVVAPAAPPAAATAPAAAAPAATPAPLTAAETAPETPPVPLGQLTPAQRQAFPPLTLGGSIWSESAANRFVIANGQVVREGEQAAPGVIVERIGQRAAILRWRDMRVELPL